ncbi:hypothetical protein BP5796_03063 [Coleophoma crateriformis]|uniref:EGF domain-specific O-linked N-acetylglucosamine transferase n=1 Tax=Coleophoma crateriformis TaxID=565419 RepID=A0A3D8SLZ8_9HELO|nr:hypothetical protein BP5796_03063 [Coleophoma crateriformis]
MLVLTRLPKLWLFTLIVIGSFYVIHYGNQSFDLSFGNVGRLSPFNSLTSDPKPLSTTGGKYQAYPSDVASLEIASTSITATSFPSDYLPSQSDDSECEALYSSRYLEYIASHHVPYCESGSRSKLECFRTHRNESLCIAMGVSIDPQATEPESKIGMQCKLRNFTVEAKSSSKAAAQLHGVLNVEDMPSGFFETGVKEQLKLWEISKRNVKTAKHIEDCTAAKNDGTWTLLVKRENHGNLFHKLMELWQAMITLDALQMAIDPSTQKPYLLPSEVPQVQVVFVQEQETGLVDELDEWWKMVTGQKPLLQRDLAPTCLGKVVLPLEGSTSPFWWAHWEEKDCHNRFLLDAFLRRVYRHLNITATKHGNETDKTIVTIIDRRDRRRIRNLEVLVEKSRSRWPAAIFQVIDFASISLREQIDLVRNTDVLVGMTGAGLTHVLWLPEESSLAEIQAPNKRMPEAQPSTEFRNLAKMRGLHYLMAHPERREGANPWDWQTGEWVDVKDDVFQALVDAAINAQLHKGLSRGEVLPII